MKDRLDLCTAGVFDFFETVYAEEDERAYASGMGAGYKQLKDGRPTDEGQRRKLLPGLADLSGVRSPTHVD
jgi:hypothetical protein